MYMIPEGAGTEAAARCVQTSVDSSVESSGGSLMKASQIFIAVFGFAALVANGRGLATSRNESEHRSACRDEPRETIEKLWGIVARGELLTAKGWDTASALFTKPASSQSVTVRVVSDYYAVNASSVDGARAIVDVGFVDEGQIDANLQYTPAASIQAIKQSLRYQLVSGPAHLVMYGPDGKTVQQVKEVPESKVWQIEGSPGPRWATVTSAVRFVLEGRDKATDIVIKKNADQTLAKLKKMH